MTPAKSRPELARYGRRGDRVKVVVDRKAKRVIVYYVDADGAKRKKFYGTSPAERAEAITWAEGYHEERKRILEAASNPAPKEKITVRQLWQKYVHLRLDAESAELRDATRVNYRQRWSKFERFVKPDTIADDVSLVTIESFKEAALQAGMARNQVRAVLNIARIVFNWGQIRRLIGINDFGLYRWSQGKDAEKALEPEEYTQEEFERLLAVTSPQSGKTWRLHVAMMLAGHHGGRALAVRFLPRDPVDPTTGELVWPAKTQKNGKEHRQPLTFEALSALLTAQMWRERTGYTGKWLIFAGGGGKAIGPALIGNERHYRKERAPDRDKPVTYGGLHTALMKAQARAGVEHKERRAMHGFRKMVAGTIADRTGDPRLAMEWINDGIQQASKYLKKRENRLERAADSVGSDQQTKLEPDPAVTAQPSRSAYDRRALHTHCKKGHELTEDNVLIHGKDRVRRCRTCRNEGQRERKRGLVSSPGEPTDG